jgi:hypothetical protein
VAPASTASCPAIPTEPVTGAPLTASAVVRLTQTAIDAQPA